MLSTADITSPPTWAETPEPSRPRPSTRLAGIGALAFAGVVVLQNVIRGSSAPANDAPASEVLAHAADHRALTFVLVATFVLSGISLVTFLGGAMRSLASSARSAWAYTGYIGAAGVMTLFAVLVASEQALSAVAHGRDPDLGAVSSLWALHNSVFTVLMLFVGIALLGLGRAGVAAGITPRAFEWLAPLGTGLLAIACAAGPGIAAGDLGDLFGLGLVGFVIWLAFLVTTGLRLVWDSEPVAERIAA